MDSLHSCLELVITRKLFDYLATKTILATATIKWQQNKINDEAAAAVKLGFGTINEKLA